MRGERAALDQLFTKSYPVVRRIVIRILGPNTPELEDVIQTALMEIYRSLKSFKGEARFTSWAFKICLNVTNQYLRQKVRKDDKTGELDERVTEATVSTEKDLLDREALAKVYELIHTLPKKYQQVFIMAEMEQMGAAEISEVLDCSVQAVWSRLHHARKMFWEKVERSDYFTNLRFNQMSDTGKSEQ